MYNSSLTHLHTYSLHGKDISYALYVGTLVKRSQIKLAAYTLSHNTLGKLFNMCHQAV